jgi:hypothetical protein
MTGDFLTNFPYERFDQLGDSSEGLQQDFRVIDSFADLNRLVV